MEDSPDLEFDYFLAEKLHMSVERMRREVDGQEYLEWSMFYARKAQRLELAQLSRR